MELETDLRVASDRLLQTLEQLESLENEKRTIEPGSQRFRRLASEIERLAAEVFAQSHRQQQLGEVAGAVIDRTGAVIPTIEDSTTPREMATILAEWRDAERRLSLATPDSAEHATATADVRRLRSEYQSTYSASLKPASGN